MPEMIEYWPVLPTATPAGPEANPLPVLPFVLGSADLCEALMTQASSQSTYAGEAAWHAQHRLIMHKCCKPLGKVPTAGAAQNCYDAEECVETESGKRLLKLKDNLRDYFSLSAQSAGFISKKQKKARNKLMQSGDCVLRFRSVEGLADGAKETWHHVALFYAKPWRPTVVELVRVPEEDRPPAVLGVRPIRNTKHLAHRTVWEMLAPWRDNCSVNVTFFKLVSDGRKVRRLRVHQQWVKEVCEIPELDLLSLPKIVTRRKKGRGGGGRRKGAKGPGEGSKGRGGRRDRRPRKGRRHGKGAGKLPLQDAAEDEEEDEEGPREGSADGSADDGGGGAEADGDSSTETVVEGTEGPTKPAEGTPKTPRGKDGKGTPSPTTPTYDNPFLSDAEEKSPLFPPDEVVLSPAGGGSEGGGSGVAGGDDLAELLELLEEQGHATPPPF